MKIKTNENTEYWQYVTKRSQNMGMASTLFLGTVCILLAMYAQTIKYELNAYKKAEKNKELFKVNRNETTSTPISININNQMPSPK